MVKMHMIRTWEFSKPGTAGGIAYAPQVAERLTADGYSVVEKPMPRLCYHDRTDGAHGLPCPGCEPEATSVKWFVIEDRML